MTRVRTHDPRPTEADSGVPLRSEPWTRTPCLVNRHPGVVVRRVRKPEPVRAIRVAVPEVAFGRSALRTPLGALREAAGG
jgi:hypothetical protein